MKTIKIRQTESFSDNTGTHTVCRGRLVFIKAEPKFGYNPHFVIEDKVYSPIIISETEEIEDGDLVYMTKVLALPEHFSPKQLQAIVDGKLRDGDEVFVECNNNYEELSGETVLNPFKVIDLSRLESFIKLTNNHIKLFPVKQEESWNDIEKLMDSQIDDSKFGSYNEIELIVDWLKANYHPPKRK